jgi:ubiquinone/menaquinone biosynthesis C-methylase UbiE
MPAYAEWSEAVFNATSMGRYITGIERKLIDQAFEDLGWPKLLLDVGGGDGRLTKQLQSKGVCPVILEHDNPPLKKLKNSKWKYPLLMGDGNLLPIRSNTIDAVMTFHVAVCTDAIHNTGYFSEVYRVLKERGLFLVVTDNKSSFIGALNKSDEIQDKQKTPYEFYSEGYLDTRRKLESAGFKIDRVKGFRWIPFPKRSDNRLIPFFSFIERYLMLGKLVNYSPWIFWAAVK